MLTLRGLAEHRFSMYLIIKVLLYCGIYISTFPPFSLYRQLLDQQAAPPTILNSGAKSPLTKAFVQLAPFLDQTNTIKLPSAIFI